MNVVKTILRICLAWAASLAAAALDFPAPYNSEPDTNSAPLPAEQAAAGFAVPDGFRVTAFAAEPDVQNPIAVAWDGRGRLWVAENYTYAERAKRFDLGLRDRLLVFEDGAGNGRFSSRRVFTDELQMLTSVEVGNGGVWLLCPPQLLFIPSSGDGVRPGGPASVALDGFVVPQENYHNFANGLRFGPDGWLYGRCGASSPGDIGAPGAPADQRAPLRGGLWRYHPRRKVFEALTSGTTNPWGHDWDENGELFFINTVNGHLWHGITGAHFVRPHTLDPNPRVYELIDQHADHWHFDTARDWTQSRAGAANAFGGGHAHAGMMIYQGDNWPAPYRGRLFTWNLHGRRANQEILERRGSGYVARHGEDLFLAADPWFRGMDLSCGPDGGVFALDWSDTGECHDSTGVHRTSGRIFKITHGEPARTAVNLGRMPAGELADLQRSDNAWFARQARLELANGAEAGKALGDAPDRLRRIFDTDSNIVFRLRALWSLNAIGAADDALLRGGLRDPNEHIRVWAIRLLTDAWPLDTEMSRRPLGRPEGAGAAALVGEFVEMARSDSSGLVRLALASTLQRLPVGLRLSVAGALCAHEEDAADHNLPLMIWYGLIPVADQDPGGLARLSRACRLPATRRLIARRLSEEIESSPGPINELLKSASKGAVGLQRDVLAGLAEGLVGWRKAAKPAGWDGFAAAVAASNDGELAGRARDLSVLFGDGRALEEVRAVALDDQADLNARKAALKAFIESHSPDVRSVCERLLSVRFLNVLAARGLGQFDDPAIGTQLVKNYRSFHPSERTVLMDTLTSRRSFAWALLNAIEDGRIPRADLTPFHARQLRSFKDPALDDLLSTAWGDIQESGADKKRRISALKARLSNGALAAADPGEGRVVFNRLCAVCHRLYGHGGTVGPDLTGAGRDNLDYLLENIVDPSAVVSADYRMTVATLKDGRVLNGIVTATTARTMTLRTMTETVSLERTEIESARPSAQSMMPEGLIESLSEEQVSSLIAYLMKRTQAPLPSGAP